MFFKFNTEEWFKHAWGAGWALLSKWVDVNSWDFVPCICRVGWLLEDTCTLKGKMLSPNDRKLEKLDPFYRSPVSKQKTSAEIISEARNALRTVRTQRPFTPREEQRKLFGPASSRTPESRPPSSFRYLTFLKYVYVTLWHFSLHSQYG